MLEITTIEHSEPGVVPDDDWYVELERDVEAMMLESGDGVASLGSVVGF